MAFERPTYPIPTTHIFIIFKLIEAVDESCEEIKQHRNRTITQTTFTYYYYQIDKLRCYHTDLVLKLAKPLGKVNPDQPYIKMT